MNCFPGRGLPGAPLKAPRYNVGVALPERESEASRKKRRRAVYASEATGLALIAGLVLVLALIRYGRYLHWSLR